MATPQAFQSIHRSSVLTAFDFYEPDVLNTLFAQYGDQGLTAFQLFRSLGMTAPATQDSFSWYEENRIHEIFHPEANVLDPTAGVEAHIILGTTYGDLTTGNQFYPRVGDEVLFANGVPGIITVIDVSNPAAPDVTVEPLVATDNIGALTAGAEIIIFSGAFAEGTDQPSSVLRGTTKRTGYCQIIKESIGATGSELVRKTWFEKRDIGGNIVGYYSTALMDLSYRLALKADGAILFGKEVTNPTLTASNIVTTAGIFPIAIERGTELPYTLGSLAVTDFDEIDRILTAQGVSTPNIMMLNGIKLSQELENVLHTYNENATDFTRVVESVFGGNQALALSVNFKSVYKSNRNYMLKRMESFNNPKTFGADKFEMQQQGIVIPMDSPRDPKSGDKSSRICIRHRKLGEYNREFEQWSLAGAGGNTNEYVSSIDAKYDYMRAHIGLQVVKANGLIVLTPTP